MGPTHSNKSAARTLQPPNHLCPLLATHRADMIEKEYSSLDTHHSKSIVQSKETEVILLKKESEYIVNWKEERQFLST